MTTNLRLDDPAAVALRPAIDRGGRPSRGRRLPAMPARRAGSLALLGAGLLLAGCSGRSDAESRRGTTPPRPDISTPEKALKSYWALIDWFHAVNEARSRGEADRQAPPLHELMATVSTGDALTSFQRYTPRRAPVERTLERVTREGDASAQVLAHIRSQSADASTGLTPTPIELFERETGGEYRYQLRNDGEGWKVAEVWRVDGVGEPRRIR